MTWIVSASFDRKWFLFPFLLSPLALVCWWIFGFSFGEPRATEVLFLVFMAFFDQPHIARTFTRTHEDKLEFNRNRWLHVGLLPVLFVVALLALLFDVSNQLLLVVACFGQWHIFKQNFGLARVYAGGGARRLEWWFFHLMFINSLCPYLGRSDIVGLETALIGTPIKIFVFVAWLVLGFFWLRSISSGPRVQFIGGWIATHLFLYVCAHFLPIPVMLVLETIYHDVQYQGWMNLYQRKVLNHGEKKIRNWILVAFAYGVFTVVADEFLGKSGLMINMIVLYHYIAEGFIWRFRSSPELRAMLLPAPDSHDFLS